MNAKIQRLAEIDRVPYVAVLGDNEAASGAVALRVRGQKGQRTLSRSDLASEITAKLRSRSFDP